VRNELRLTASAGVSVNKFVAKIASDLNKPDGLTFIGPSRIEAFMETLAVEKFHGVGKVTAQKMKMMGLHTGADLKKLSEGEMEKRFGKTGRFFYKIVRGQDDRAVQPHRETKSIGAEDTFPYDLVSEEEMHPELAKLATVLCGRLQRYGLKGRTITLKIKYSNFHQITRSQSFAEGTNHEALILSTARALLAATDLEDVKVRLLGISLSNFHETPIRIKHQGDLDQLALF
jgi:DNA polymerase-4